MYQTLNRIADEVRAGRQDFSALEQAAMQGLADRQWKPDYVAIRKRSNLQAPDAADIAANEALVVLTAAKLGNTRLIDNLEI